MRILEPEKETPNGKSLNLLVELEPHEKEAHTIFLKALFVFAEKEGYGVKQAWLSQLPETLKATAHALIFENAPLHKDCESDYIKMAKQLAEGLIIWIQTNTDIQMS